MRIRERSLSTPRVVERDLDLTRSHPMATPPVWKVIFDDLRGKIFSGGYGERIPSERDLAESYGVARPTIREVLRVLQFEGLIEIQRSNLGGALVTWPSKRSEEEIREEIRRKLPQLLYTLDLRVAVESFAAHQAALKHTKEHLKALEESVQTTKDASKVLAESEKTIADANSSPQEKQAASKKRESAMLDYRRAGSVFHRAVAVAARNPSLLEAIEGLRTEFFPATDFLDRSSDQRSKVIEEHGEILERIEAQDKDGAAEAMQEHILSSKIAFSELLENQLEYKIAVEGDTSDPDTAANAVRDSLRETKVLVLGLTESVNAEGIAEENDLFDFIIDGPGGQEQIMVPVFTRHDFLRAALDRNPDWQVLATPELRGSELLSELEPQLTVIINPWSSLEFQLPVG